MSIIKREPSLLHSISPFLGDSFWGDVFPQDSQVLSSMGQNMAIPRVDVCEKENCYLVTADLPGVNKDDIELSVSEGLLTIKAHAQNETKEEDQGQIVCQERFEGEYLRQLSLGKNASQEKVNAKFSNGVLSITIDKIEPKKPESMKIEIH